MNDYYLNIETPQSDDEAVVMAPAIPLDDGSTEAIIAEGVKAAMESYAVLEQYRFARKHVAEHGITVTWALESDQEMPELNLLDAVYGHAKPHQARVAVEGIGTKIRDAFVALKNRVIKILRAFLDFIKKRVSFSFNSNSKAKIVASQYGRGDSEAVKAAAKEATSVTTRVTSLEQEFASYVQNLKRNAAGDHAKIKEIDDVFLDTLTSYFHNTPGLTGHLAMASDNRKELVKALSSHGDLCAKAAIELMEAGNIRTVNITEKLHTLAVELYRMNIQAVKALEVLNDTEVSDIIRTRRFRWQDVLDKHPKLNEQFVSSYAEKLDAFAKDYHKLEANLTHQQNLSQEYRDKIKESETAYSEITGKFDPSQTDYLKWLNQYYTDVVTLGKAVTATAAKLERSSLHLTMMESLTKAALRRAETIHNDLPDGTGEEENEFYNRTPGEHSDIEPVYEHYYDLMLNTGIVIAGLLPVQDSAYRQCQVLQGVFIEASIDNITLRQRIVKKLAKFEPGLKLEGAGLELAEDLAELADSLRAECANIFKG